MKKIKFIFIGYGNIAKRHISIISKILPNSFFYIAVNNPEKYVQKKNIKITKFKNLKVDKSIDYIFICSPATSHVDYISRLSKLNKKIFVEKPLAHNLVSIKKLKNLSQKKKKRILVGYVFRKNNIAIKIKKLISSNYLGKIVKVNSKASSYLPDWRKNKNFRKSVSSQKKLGGGVLLELSHELDYLLWFFKDITVINSELFYYKKFNLDVESGAKINCLINKNSFLNIEIDFHSKKTLRYCEIIGSKKKLIWYLNKNKLEIINNISLKKKTFHFFDDMYRNQIKFFLSKKNFGNSLTESIKVISLINQIKKKNIGAQNI